jgi:hypothetical protein
VDGAGDGKALRLAAREAPHQPVAIGDPGDAHVLHGFRCHRIRRLAVVALADVLIGRSGEMLG